MDTTNILELVASCNTNVMPINYRILNKTHGLYSQNLLSNSSSPCSVKDETAISGALIVPGSAESCHHGFVVSDVPDVLLSR
jgi:hypothetical protein